MIQIYADNDSLVYDTRLNDYGLLGASVTVGTQISGAAEFTMPPNHPA